MEGALVMVETTVVAEAREEAREAKTAVL